MTDNPPPKRDHPPTSDDVKRRQRRLGLTSGSTFQQQEEPNAEAARPYALSLTPYDNSVSQVLNESRTRDVRTPPRLAGPPKQEPSVLDRVPKLSARAHRMSILWLIINCGLMGLVIVALAGGIAGAAWYGIDRWRDDPVDPTTGSQVLPEQMVNPDCDQPGSYRSPANDQKVRPRLDRTPLRTAPGSTCPSKGMVHTRNLLVPLSGEVPIDGTAWILVRVYDDSGELPEAVEGWIPADDLVPAE